MAFTETIKDWMTQNVVTINEEDSIIDADEKMREYGVRRLPVVNNKGKLVGIVTKGDVREASPSDATMLSIWEVNYLIAKLQVKRVMTSNVMTISPEADIIDAAQIMLDRKVSGIPVVDDAQQLVGIVTESDIFRMLVKTRLKEQETVG
jgi:acetoin utilization protein AcuB